MAWSTSRALIARPERIYETKLLTGIEDFSCSFFHGAQNLRGLINGYEVILTSSLMRRPWRKGAEVIFHGHGKPAKPAAAAANSAAEAVNCTAAVPEPPKTATPTDYWTLARRINADTETSKRLAAEAVQSGDWAGAISRLQEAA